MILWERTSLSLSRRLRMWAWRPTASVHSGEDVFWLINREA
jgi:hypothetical protein